MTLKKTAVCYLPQHFNALEAVGFAEAIGLVPGFDVRFVGDKAGPIQSDGGSVELTAQASFKDVTSADVLFIGSGRVVHLLSDERLLTWIRELHAKTEFTTAVCVGRFLLGAAGLLDGVRVVHQPVPLPAYGAIEVHERLHAHGKIITAANAASGIDLGLHVAARYADQAAARAMQVALEYDVDTWAPPFAPRELPPPTPDELNALMGLMTHGAIRPSIMKEIMEFGQRARG
jgi:transcriptional regulator GlxA family with amidase domain